MARVQFTFYYRSSGQDSSCSRLPLKRIIKKKKLTKIDDPALYGVLVVLKHLRQGGKKRAHTIQEATEEGDETAGPTAVRTMGIRDGGWTRRGVIRRGKKFGQGKGRLFGLTKREHGIFM